MPANFPELWESRVRTNLTSATNAPFLDGIAELDSPVIESGSGDASEANSIHIPISTFEPDVLINNSTYPLAVQAYSDTEAVVQLDKYQTKVTTLTDDQVIGASYNRIDTATASHTTAITKKKYAKAIHALAPSTNSSNTPVLQTTGALSGGRRRLVYNDIVALKQKFDDMECPVEGRRLVLSTDHWNDMLLDRDRFGINLVDYGKGVVQNVAGFEIFSYVANPYYTTAGTVKVAFGAAPGGSDFRASVAFYTGNVAKKTGMTKQYFRKAADDPDNQTNRIAYRHYYINLPIQNKYIGAIASATS